MTAMATLRRLELPALLLLGALTGAAISELAYLTQPVVPLAVGGALAMVILAVARPMLSLYAAIALAPLELLSFSLGAAAVSPAEVLLAVTGLGWAVSRLLRGQAPFAPSPLGKPLTLLVLALVPGIAIAPEPAAVIKVLLMWGSFLLLYEMIVIEGRPDTVRNLLLVLGLSAAVVGLIAIVKSGGAAPELKGLGDTATGRAQGSFGHPNTLATFEVLALPGVLALGLRGPSGIRPAALASFAVIFAALALSLSRGGFLAVVGALGMMLAWAPFRRPVIAVALIGVALTAGGFNVFGDTQQVRVVSQRFESITYSAEGVDPRFVVWQITPRIIADHPVFGIGENAFPRIAQRYGLLGPDSLSTFEHAHNIPLTITVELGFAGLAVLVWLVVALTGVIARGLRRVEPEHRGMLLAVAAAFVGIALQGMVDYTLRSNVIVAAIFVLAGCAVVLGRHGAPAAPGGDAQSPPASV